VKNVWNEKILMNQTDVENPSPLLFKKDADGSINFHRSEIRPAKVSPKSHLKLL